MKTLLLSLVAALVFCVPALAAEKSSDAAKPAVKVQLEPAVLDSDPAAAQPPAEGPEIRTSTPIDEEPDSPVPGPAPAAKPESE